MLRAWGKWVKFDKEAAPLVEWRMARMKGQDRRPTVLCCLGKARRWWRALRQCQRKDHKPYHLELLI